MMHYTCDGPGCGAKGEPRGPARALPAGWVMAVVEGRTVELCLKCWPRLASTEMKRREEKQQS